MSSPRHFPVLRVVLPAADEADELCWFAFNADRTPKARGKSALAELPRAGAVEVVLPAWRVSVHTLTLPEQAGKHLDALIGQALEDRLLGDRADILAIPGPHRGSERRVWACGRRWLEAWLERLAAAGLKPAGVVPDHELLPEAADATACAATDAGILFRAGGGGRLGIARDEATVRRLAGTAALQFVPELHCVPCPAACSAALPRSVARFAKQSFDPGRWVPSLVLVGAAAAVLLLGALIHWRQLESRDSRLQHEIRQTFATAFPGTPIVDPVLQWESRQRAAAQGGADALDAVVDLAARLNAPVRPRRIEAGEGFIRLILADSEVAQFKAQLEAAGKPETSPAEAGLARLTYRIAR